MAHFCFGIGAFFSPFIVEPFLREVANLDHFERVSSKVSITNSTISSINSTTITELDVPVKTPLIIDPSSLKLKWAYFMIGTISLIIWLMFLITYLNKRDNKPHPTREVKVKETKKKESFVKLEIVKMDDSKKDESQKDDTKKDENKTENSVLKVEKKIRPYHKTIMVLLGALFIHLGYGLELSFGTMLASYARLSNLHMTKTSASYATS